MAKTYKEKSTDLLNCTFRSEISDVLEIPSSSITSGE